MHILEDLFYAIRYVKFGTITGPDGNSVNVNHELGDIANNWRGYIENSFMKEYLPRLMEYCRMLENSPEARTSV
jgi:flagellar basal body rod protein FlgB